MEFQILVGAGATVLLLRKWWHSVCWICLRNIFEEFESVVVLCVVECGRYLVGSHQTQWCRVFACPCRDFLRGTYSLWPPWSSLLGSAGLADGGPHLSLHKSTVQILTPTTRSRICPAYYYTTVKSGQVHAKSTSSGARRGSAGTSLSYGPIMS